MGFLSDLFNRGGRVVRGQANAGMSAVEDATFEATVKQTVADMRTELNKAIQASAVAMSNYNRLDAEYQKYVRQSQDWKDRANMALDANNEDLAKKALAKKTECDRQVASMQTAVDQAKQASETLKTQVAELKKKIDEGERTATTLVARKNAAHARRRPRRRSTRWHRRARMTTWRRNSRNWARTASTRSLKR
jgi:phage shock protein A